MVACLYQRQPRASTGLRLVTLLHFSAPSLRFNPPRRRLTTPPAALPGAAARYSVLRLFAGFTIAAPIDLYPTETQASPIEMNSVAKNIPGLISIR